MRFTVEDSRRYPNDHSWALGVWWHHAYGDESSIDMGLGYRSFCWTWGRARQVAPLTLAQFLLNPTIGFGVDRDPDGVWGLWFGPWMWDFA